MITPHQRSAEKKKSRPGFYRYALIGYVAINRFPHCLMQYGPLTAPQHVDPVNGELAERCASIEEILRIDYQTLADALS